MKQADPFERYIENRRASLVSELIRLYREQKLTESAANGLAAGLYELTMVMKEKHKAVAEQENEFNALAKSSLQP